MADIESLYRRENGHVLIEIKLLSVIQLFNSFDPAPFHEKEIDIAAEHYIVGVVKDFSPKTRFRILIYLPETIADTERAQKIPAAIRNHFAYRAMTEDRKYRDRLHHGRWALLIGLIFVTIAMIVRQLVYASLGSNHLVSQIIADSLLIIGWAAMWEPVTVLLYELWPIIQQKKLYERISAMEIDVLPYVPQSYEMAQ